MPTPDRCRELGVKFDGLAIRTQHWLLGVATGVGACDSDQCCNLYLGSKNSFDVETNYDTILNVITKRLEDIGFTRELVTA